MRDRLRASPALALALLTAIAVCGFIDRIVLNVLLEPIKREFGASDTAMGLLSGLAFSVLNVGLSLWVARLAERRGRLRLVAIGTLLWSIATALCGAAGSFAQLALARVGVGVGEAVGLPATQSIVSDLYPRERRTTALAVLTLGPTLGAFIGSAGGAAIAQGYGWRVAFIAAAAPGVVLALLAAWLHEPQRGRFDPPRADADTVPPLSAVFARLWQRRSLRQLIAGMGIATAAGFGVNVFASAFLVRRFGFSVGGAGLATGLIASIPASLGNLGAGWLSDKLGARDPRARALIPAATLALACPLYVLAVTRTNASWAIAFLAAAALVQYSYIAPTYGVIQTMSAPRMRASAAALIGIVSSLVGSSLGPIITGGLSDTLAGGLPAAMAITAVGYLWAAGHYARGAHHLRTEWHLPS